MSASRVTLARGDIVARAGYEAVVWERRAERVTLLPIVPVSELRRRADVDMTEIDVEGALASRHGLIRCSMPTNASIFGQLPIGRLVDDALKRVAVAVAQAEAARRIEASPPIASHLSRTNGPGQRGRRVGAKSAN